MKDVARQAGVNISTASRALNNSFGIHRETRRRVIEAAARLNYRTNQVAMQHLEADRNMTAIFAGNDVIAFGCLRAIMEKGARIPEDISIMGFDNVADNQPALDDHRSAKMRSRKSRRRDVIRHYGKKWRPRIGTPNHRRPRSSSASPAAGFPGQPLRIARPLATWRAAAPCVPIPPQAEIPGKSRENTQGAGELDYSPHLEYSYVMIATA